MSGFAGDWPGWLRDGAMTSVSVALLVLLILIVRRPFARAFGAKAAYALWLIPLARLAWPKIPAGWTLFGLGGGEPQAALAAVPVRTAPDLSWTGRDTTVFEAVSPVRDVPEAARLPEALPWSAETGAGWHWPAEALALVWALGALALIGWGVWRQARFAWLVTLESRPAPAAMQARMEAMRRSLGIRAPVSLRTSLLCGGPLVTGLTRPVVLVPDWFATDYTAQEQEHALMHELMHVRRGDVWALQIAHLVRALHWFNPLVHLALGAFRSDQEAACDVDVLARTRAAPRDYGKTLVKTVRLTAAPHAAVAGLPLANAIKERLILMSHPAPSRLRRAGGLALAAALGATLLTATASPAPPAAPDAPDAPKPPKVRTVKKSVFALRGAPGDGDDAHSLSIITGDDADGELLLLSDPFAALHPKFAEFEALSEADMAELEALAPMPPMPVEFDTDVLLVGMPGLQVEKVPVEGGTKLVIPAQEIFIPEGEAGFEWHAEMLAERADEIAERAEAIAEAHEEMADAYAERAEAIATRIEMRFEADSEATEAAGETVEALADACEEAEGGAVASAINEADGKTYRALCLAGLPEGTDLDALVAGHPGLTPEEKAAYAAGEVSRASVRH